MSTVYIYAVLLNFDLYLFVINDKLNNKLLKGNGFIMTKFNCKYILFDLDGTITESDPGITHSIKYALEKNSMVSPSLEELKIFVGPPLGEKFMEVFGVSQEMADKLLVSYRERYNSIGKYECNIYDGIVDALKQLREMGKVLCVATSKPEAAAKDVLAHFGLTEYFDLIGGDTAEHTRPNKTAVINYVMESMNISDKDDIIMVGDTHYDVEGANKIGIKCIGVTYGYDTEESLKNSGAAAIIHKPIELVDLF